MASLTDAKIKVNFLLVKVKWDIVITAQSRGTCNRGSRERPIPSSRFSTAFFWQNSVTVMVNSTNGSKR